MTAAPLLDVCLFGDVRASLRAMIAEGVKVQTVVTSPPYYHLRNYGHPDQLGLEPTPAEYVANMVDVFALVREVLDDRGTLWLNLGDSYGAKGGDTYKGFDQRYHGTGGAGSKQDATLEGVKDQKMTTGLAKKNLLGMPWRVAFALQEYGWILRQDIIWHKTNGIPESATDRVTKAHEYLFLFSKGPRYFFDHKAIREPATKGYAGSSFSKGKTAAHQLGRMSTKERKEDGKRNRRSVWSLSAARYRKAHFATFPPALVEPCILAGSRPGDVVLDPFMGSGTTAEVATRLGRHWLGCELNPEYLAMQEERVAKGLAARAKAERAQP